MSSLTSLSTGETDPDERELGVLLTGGRDSTSSPLDSAEFFGSDSCYVPPLPEPRTGHVTFVTPKETIATCGGWSGADGREDRQCLVLEPGEGGGWSQGVMGDLVLGENFATSCPTTLGDSCIFPFKFSYCMYPVITM